MDLKCSERKLRQATGRQTTEQ